MDIDTYSDKTDSTAVYPDRAPENQMIVPLLYCGVKLCGEAGEVAEHIGKLLRDDDGMITQERRESLKKELGDVFWYLARICRHLDLKPSEVLQANIDKLESRKQRGRIHGSGSDR